uniref:Uncharacterized protein n=1 Tax=Nomascus leucogenys TaxID=61853 RepID=A0A2I3HYQ3_NOMLE
MYRRHFWLSHWGRRLHVTGICPNVADAEGEVLVLVTGGKPSSLEERPLPRAAQGPSGGFISCIRGLGKNEASFPPSKQASPLKAASPRAAPGS